MKMNVMEHLFDKPDWVYNTAIVNDIGKYKDLRGTIRSDGSLDCDKFLQLALKELSETLGRYRYKHVSKVEKTARKSIEYRERGNHLFRSTDNINRQVKALKLYNRCIANAPFNSEEIAIGYANRSAVFLKFNRLEECLVDIDRALQSPNYPARLKPKLYIRKAECYAKLAQGCYGDSQTWLNKMPHRERATVERELRNHHFTTSKDEFVDQECIIPKLKSPSSKFPCASDGLDITYSREFGRHIVATRDIKVGEVLVVEKPYFHFLEDTMSYTNCFHCMGFAGAAIPCDECVNAIFCSEKCKLEAWNAYHKEECTLHDLIKHYGCYLSGGRCTRLLIQMLNEAGGPDKLRDRINMFNTFNREQDWHVSETWHQNPSLETIMALPTNFDKQPKERFRIITLHALSTLFLIVTNSDILGIKYNSSELCDADIALAMSKNPDILFFGQLLLRFHCLILFDSYRVSEMETDDKVRRGDFILPFSSYFNHSCCPNILRQSKRDHMVFYASIPIQKGEQVCVAFNETQSATTPLQERQQFLKDNYFFTCRCKACQEDWPMFEWDGTECTIENTIRYWSGNYKVQKAFLTSLEIGGKVRHGRLEDKDQMLAELYKIVELFYRKPLLSSSALYAVIDNIQTLYNVTGNTSKLKLQFPLQDINEESDESE